MVEEYNLKVVLAKSDVPRHQNLKIHGGLGDLYQLGDLPSSIDKSDMNHTSKEQEVDMLFKNYFEIYLA